MQSEISNDSVIITFDYGIDSLDPIFELQMEMDKVLRTARAGICDGHAVALDSSHGIYYLYGDNAETVFKLVKPIMEQYSFMKGANALLKFEPAALEIEVTI